MQQSELYQLLASTGLDVYFYQTGQPVSLPYIVYLRDGTSSYGSDDKNCIRKDSYIVEFYSDEQDEINQSKIETALDNAGISYTTAESHLDSENMYMVAFNFELTRKV